MNTTDTTDTPTMRPLAQRITPGKMQAHRGDPTSLWALNKDDEDDGYPRISISVVYGIVQGEKTPLDEQIADAELIAEAFNTTHETGRTPGELADERAELLQLIAGQTMAIHDARKALLAASSHLIPSTNAAALVSASIAELGQILDAPAKGQPQTPAVP